MTTRYCPSEWVLILTINPNVSLVSKGQNHNDLRGEVYSIAESQIQWKFAWFPMGLPVWCRNDEDAGLVAPDDTVLGIHVVSQQVWFLECIPWPIEWAHWVLEIHPIPNTSLSIDFDTGQMMAHENSPRVRGKSMTMKQAGVVSWGYQTGWKPQKLRPTTSEK